MTRMTEKPIRTAPPAFMNADRPLDILMIGAGGNGSAMFDGLVRLHAALIALGGKGLNVCVLDDDEVSPSNVIRQRFWPHQVGENKAVALVQQANLMLGTGWTAMPMRFKADRDADPYNLRPDLVMTAVDNLDARRAVVERFPPARTDAEHHPWQRQSHRDVFWLDMGNGKSDGQVVFGRFGDNRLTDEWPCALAHYPEILTREDAQQEPSCSAAESLARQDLFINSAISLSAVNILWKLMREGKLAINAVLVDLATGTTQTTGFLPASNQTQH